MAAFTDTEVETLREIIDLPGFSQAQIDDLTERLDFLNAAQKTATQTDISKWNAIKFGTTKVKGGSKGTDYDIDRDRLLIQNRVRGRLGYPKVASNIQGEVGVFVVNSPMWDGLVPTGDGTCDN